MKPLYKLTDKNKETKFNLFVYGILDDIDKKVTEWFNEVYIEPKEYMPSAILNSNLKEDLDYLLTQAIWLINLGKSLGYNIEAERWVESTYKIYKAKPTGYRNLVKDERYNKLKNKLYTLEEVIENKKRNNEIGCKILAEILAQSK